MMNKLPQFQVKRIFDNGSQEPPEIVPILQLPSSTKMNRRGFIGAGMAVSAALGLISCATTRQNVDTEQKNDVMEHKEADKCAENILAHAEGVQSISFSPDGKWLASGASDKTIKIWEIPSCKLTATLKGHIERVNSISFSPDGKWLASGSGDHAIKLWEFPSGKFSTTLESHTGEIVSVSFSPDGKWLASGAFDSIKVWNIPSGKLAATFEVYESNYHSISFSPNGKLLASSFPSFREDTFNQAIKLLDIPSGKQVSSFKSNHSDLGPVSFSPDGKWLASASFYEVLVWKVSSRKLSAALTGHTAQVDSVAFSPDGKWVASASPFDSIKLWELPSFRLAATLESNAGTISFSQDSKLLASGALNGSIKLWEMPVGKFVTCFFDPAALENGKEAVQYTGVNEYGQTIVYSGPCGSSVPPGFMCTCNCVPGTYSPPGSGETNCTCNQVCTCVPVYR
jgi:WD40 repeat protein